MNIAENVYFVGVVDKELKLFENQYPLRDGATFNSYVITDDKIAVLDTVEAQFGDEWLNNVNAVLKGRTPDYLIISHMEPDHSANIKRFKDAYPDVKLVGNAKTFPILKQFFNCDFADTVTVKEGDEINLGSHTLKFFMAPMVHWPEVMVTYETSEKILFSADAFGKFGSSLTCEDWTDEARRYYINIVGKFGMQASALLKKAATLDIKTIAPLHGPVLTGDLSLCLDKYTKWSGYIPEEKGTLIAYASIYGNTEKAAYALKDMLEERGEKTEIYSLATSDISEVVAKAFKYDKLVCASVSYDAGIFPAMSFFLMRLKSKNFQGRKVGLIENTSFAPSALRVMKPEFEAMKNITIVEPSVSVKSAPDEASYNALKELAENLLK